MDFFKFSLATESPLSHLLRKQLQIRTDIFIFSWLVFKYRVLKNLHSKLHLRAVK